MWDVEGGRWDVGYGMLRRFNPRRHKGRKCFYTGLTLIEMIWNNYDDIKNHVDPVDPVESSHPISREKSHSAKSSL